VGWGENVTGFLGSFLVIWLKKVVCGVFAASEALFVAERGYFWGVAGDRVVCRGVGAVAWAGFMWVRRI
jgi:hypothetical protein